MAAIAGHPRLVRGGRDGAIAQLGERVVRNDEVGGSIPPGSTTLRPSGFAWRSHVMAEERSVPGVAPLGEDGLWPQQTLINSLPRKPRRPLLHKTRHPLAKIAATQCDRHLAVGIDGGFGHLLERHVVELLLDHGYRARRHV